VLAYLMIGCFPSRIFSLLSWRVAFFLFHSPRKIFPVWLGKVAVGLMPEAAYRVQILSSISGDVGFADR